MNFIPEFTKLRGIDCDCLVVDL